MDLKRVASMIRSRVHQDWDLVVAIAGEEGSGKSTLAIQLAKLIDPRFKVETHIIFDPKNKLVVEKVTKLPKYSCIILDEAIKTMYKLNWASSEQKILNMAFALGRKYNQIVLLCIPRFRDLNEQFRNHRAKIWIQVIKRGVAAIFGPDRGNIWHQDPWRMDEYSRFMQKATKRQDSSSTDIAKSALVWGKVDSYLGHVVWDTLPKELEEEYKTLKGEVDLATLEAGTKSEQIDKAKQTYWNLRKDGFSKKECMRLCGISRSKAQRDDIEGKEKGIIPWEHS